MRYTLVLIEPPPEDRHQKAAVFTVALENPCAVQKAYDKYKEKGLKVQVLNHYLNMDETFMFEGGRWK